MVSHEACQIASRPFEEPSRTFPTSIRVLVQSQFLELLITENLVQNHTSGNQEAEILLRIVSPLITTIRGRQFCEVLTEKLPRNFLHAYNALVTLDICFLSLSWVLVTLIISKSSLSSLHRKQYYCYRISIIITKTACTSSDHYRPQSFSNP